MKSTLLTLVAAAIIAPTVAFADSTITTTIDNTNDGYYMNRPTTDVSKTAIIRDDNYDVRGNRVVREREMIDGYTTDTTVTKTVSKVKYGSDSGFRANRPVPENTIVQQSDTEVVR